MTADYVQRKEAGRRMRISLLPKALRDIVNMLEPDAQAGKTRNNMMQRAEQKISEQSDHIRKLEEAALMDSLTGLLNRRGFAYALNRELGRAERGHNKGGLLVLIEIENLKNINHIHSTRAGDVCLNLIGHALKNEIRTMDAAAFIGGDEFALLLPNAEKEQALERAQKLALRLNNMSFIWRGTEIAITSALSLKIYGPGDLADSMFRKDRKNTTEIKGAEARA